MAAVRCVCNVSMCCVRVCVLVGACGAVCGMCVLIFVCMCGVYEFVCVRVCVGCAGLCPYLQIVEIVESKAKIEV